jgi:hypothetical protein
MFKPVEVEFLGFDGTWVTSCVSGSPFEDVVAYLFIVPPGSHYRLVFGDRVVNIT